MCDYFCINSLKSRIWGNIVAARMAYPRSQVEKELWTIDKSGGNYCTVRRGGSGEWRGIGTPALNVSLGLMIILSRCPDSPPVYRSTLSDGSYFVKKRETILTDMNRLSDGEI